jgi:hypothetical protein
MDLSDKEVDVVSALATVHQELMRVAADTPRSAAGRVALAERVRTHLRAEDALYSALHTDLPGRVSLFASAARGRALAHDGERLARDPTETSDAALRAWLGRHVTWSDDDFAHVLLADCTFTELLALNHRYQTALATPRA